MSAAAVAAATSTFDEVPSLTDVADWPNADVLKWASGQERCSANMLSCLQTEDIDGQVLLALTEEDIRDFRYRLHYQLTFSELKKLWLWVRALQQRCDAAAAAATTTTPSGASTQTPEDSSPLHHRINAGVGCCGHSGAGAFVNNATATTNSASNHICNCQLPSCSGGECENFSPPMSIDGRATNIPPEFFKTAISIGYSFLVTGITSFVMVIVHERVPDMKRYPPLPDIFLDNVPHIPWAFHMCEITGTLLFAIWSCVCLFHRYRMVLLRRFFALAGTVFLLRCVTMLITSLSVPGTHLQCHQNDYAIDDTELSVSEALALRITRAYTIWSGLGMSIQGVRTCGDYMFSGHTVALTLLNFFITEYTPRNLYFLHTLTWLLNMFGIFFILAAHEHYSIDVFVAFYITSRLFLYYHTLANNQVRALMQRDSNRTRIWFPMFSYFESSVDGIVPNEFDTIGTILDDLLSIVIGMKDFCMMTAHRYWIDPPIATKNLLFAPKKINSKQCNVATSTHSSVCSTPTAQPSTQVSRTSFVMGERPSSSSSAAEAKGDHGPSTTENLLSTLASTLERNSSKKTLVFVEDKKQL